jgi:hypothetical protein
VLCFSYNEYDLNEWSIFFEKAGTILSENDTLIIPTIGVNNGVTYWQSAISIFNGLLSCLSEDNSSLHKLSNIYISTIYSTNENSSVRVINHLFNLIKIYNMTINEKECIVCFEHKVNCILPCNHIQLCKQCSYKIRVNEKNACPICRQTYLTEYDCHEVKDESNFKCCDDENIIKEQKIFIPCGHYKSCCVTCGPKYNADNKCPVCEQSVEKYLNIFFD